MKFSNRLRLWRINFKRSLLGLKQGEMYPDWGHGKYVDVLKKRGGYTVITSHSERVLSKPGTMILIPYQPNHGVMVEYRPADGKNGFRSVLDYDALYQLFASKQEQGILTKESEEA
jgi:hypothetical protein